ncbi:hypothetical protein Dsin_016570 [Dipteronia sinensis]|uniref:RRM domain-containing protein n=1 Tax=Dipteronia sinensis TaxID=43782 RepID=A0AAE0E5R3_9ROSI|nr:hypothetical protein Dsin_016570 [Dipteronia sinensis]
MREKAGVKSSKTFGLGGSRRCVTFDLGGRKREVALGCGVSKDFRDSLHSIFVDNINPSVDSTCLWCTFKAFGKVRDVYLSSKTSSRKSGFAFIRFETIEEANKVVMSTNGMHIHGMLSSSKVASYGWNNRRSHVERGTGWNYDSGVSRADRSFNQNSSLSFSTFADVVKREKQRNREERMEKEKKCMTMRWKRQRDVDNWLSKCAVGVLKQFGNVSSVSKRLKDKGFRFSSSYAGDKSILWVFDSEDEKNVFMLNRFFWDDCFSSMTRWSEAIIPQSRLSWINVVGVPLSCWDRTFFKNLGWKIGEHLLVEEETAQRSRFDFGKLLVLIPQDRQMPVKIKVDMEDFSFNVKLKEDPMPIVSSWLKMFLGLEDNISSYGLNFLPKMEMKDFLPGKTWWSKGAEVSCQEVRILGGVNDARQLMQVFKRVRNGTNVQQYKRIGKRKEDNCGVVGEGGSGGLQKEDGFDEPSHGSVVEADLGLDLDYEDGEIKSPKDMSRGGNVELCGNGSDGM